jgi:hypothetical protein
MLIIGEIVLTCRWMGRVEASIRTYGNLSKSQTLPINLLAWASYQLQVPMVSRGDTQVWKRGETQGWDRLTLIAEPWAALTHAHA